MDRIDFNEAFYRFTDGKTGEYIDVWKNIKKLYDISSKKYIDNTYGYIYLVINMINGMLYIGQHKGNEFDYKYNGSGKRLINAEDIYGIDNFCSIILEWCDSLDNLNNSERFWIDEMDSVESDVFYNIVEGGGARVFYGKDNYFYGKHFTGENNPFYGKKHSKESIHKMLESRKRTRELYSEEDKERISRNISEAQRREDVVRRKRESLKNYYKTHDNPMKGKKMSEEAKRKISEIKKEQSKGENNPFYGKHHSDETKRKLSEINKNKVVSEESRKKMSESQKKRWSEMSEEDRKEFAKKGIRTKKDRGYRVSDETKRKISEANKGKIKGIKRSEETRKRMSEARKGVKPTKETIDKANKTKKERYNGKNLKLRVNIICLETKKVYNGYDEVVKDFGWSKSKICSLLNSEGQDSYKGKTLMRYDKYKEVYGSAVEIELGEEVEGYGSDSGRVEEQREDSVSA